MMLSNSIPRTPQVITRQDVDLGKLQQKMMDNGWQLFYEEDTGNTYFKHKTYGATKFRAHQVKTNISQYTFPIISQDEDPKGLGCSFKVHHGTALCEVVSNEWVSYWNTRKGRRREKYLVYLAARQKKKAMIEEEMKKNQDQLKKAYKSL